MNLSERILRIATSHWTERSCFALTLAAALTGDGRMWIAAGTAVALTVGAIVAGSIAPLREARHAARDFPHTPEYEAYARRRAANEADDRHRIDSVGSGRPGQNAALRFGSAAPAPKSRRRERPATGKKRV